MRRTFQLANIAIEGNEIVGQEGFEAANAGFNAPDAGFNAPDAAFDFAIQPPSHGAEPAHDHQEGYKFCPVHGAATLADSEVPAHVRSAAPCLPSCQPTSGDIGRSSYNDLCIQRGAAGFCSALRHVLAQRMFPLHPRGVSPNGAPADSMSVLCRLYGIAQVAHIKYPAEYCC